jgi:hypothetical protein
MIIDPPDGRIPALTAEAKTRPVVPGTSGYGPFNTIDDFSPWDRCITRGVAGSWLPVVYGNGTRIMQTPDSVIIVHEMVHETRVIPIDTSTGSGSGGGHAHSGAGIRQYMGMSRGHWEGGTLVIETTNFNGRASYRGSSDQLVMVEKFRREGPDTLRYEVTLNDPSTWAAPWTAALNMSPQTQGMFEYACHEGNNAMRNMLSAARASEKK